MVPATPAAPVTPPVTPETAAPPPPPAPVTEAGAATAATAVTAPADDAADEAPAPDEQQAPGMPRGPLMLPVPYGEVLLSGARVARVQAVLAQLAAAGFQGEVDIQAFPGTFCLGGDASQGFAPPAATAAAASCNLMGNPVLEAAGGPQAESAAFTTALEEFRRAHGDKDHQRARDSVLKAGGEGKAAVLDVPDHQLLEAGLVPAFAHCQQ